MKTLYIIVFAVLIVQLVGCGALMYPERKGQRSGRIDIGVVILDGIGLLVYLIPGIIAYTVDFYSGTIYLPATVQSSPVLHDIKKKLNIQ